MKFQCIVQGEESPFTVNIKPTIDGRNSAIGDLQSVIQYNKRNGVLKNIDAGSLVLWKVILPTTESINFSTTISFEKFLKHFAGKKLNSTHRVSTYFTSDELDTDGIIHVVVERPPEQGSPAKRRRLDEGWRSYTTLGGQSLDLPSKIVDMLNDNEFVPEPRDNFRAVLQNVRAGQSIILPSLGQDPKYFEEGYQGRTFFVTKQMIEMWEILSKDQTATPVTNYQRIRPRSIKRVLSGPMGVGKSYLALFLAAKAYSENWPMLYIADAAKIDKDSKEESSEEICKRFFAINKDILTASELMKLVRHADTDSVEVTCASAIFGSLLQQKDRKTLLVVDEHGILFKNNPPTPVRLPILKPLMNLTFWGEEVAGARVILTGTAHANFERTYLDNGNWLEFVGPLSEDIFDMLLSLHPFLGKPAIAPKVKTIVNCIPRELMHLDKYVKGLDGNYIPEDTIDEALKIFRKVRADAFLKIARNYFESLSDGAKMYYHKALSSMFLRWSDISSTVSFDEEFLDTGLVYRFEDNYKYVKYKCLCPAALDALLEVYTMFPLPRDVNITSLKEGWLTGNNFEEILFQQLVKFTYEI